jgi:proline iminopeptidase
MPDLYPEIEPYKTGRLKVSDIHELYYELCGNPKGKPALHLHGGPGGSVSAHYRRFFNPDKYHLIRLHQRGAGLSTPQAEIKDNTTQHLIADIEKLRSHLNIEKWLVYGGSWGSTLGLAYAQEFPDNITEMVLWGIFLGSKEQSAWSFQNGANALFPDAWEDYVAEIDPADRDDILAAYYRKLTGADFAERLRAAKAFSLWDAKLLMHNPSPAVLDELINEFVADEFAIKIATLACYYFINECFLKPGQLLSGVDRIRHIPATIVHGRYDMICPLKYAWQLHKAWPEARLVIVPGAGHSGKELPMQQAIIEALDSFM